MILMVVVPVVGVPVNTVVMTTTTRIVAMETLRIMRLISRELLRWGLVGRGWWWGGDY